MSPVRLTEKLSAKPSFCRSPVNLAFDLSLIAFYDFILVSCLSCLEVCPNESLPKSDDRNMFKFGLKFEKKNRKICARGVPYLDLVMVDLG